MPSRRERATSKPRRPRRQVILFLVEGITEIRALGPYLESMYDEHCEGVSVQFCKMRYVDKLTRKEVNGGDITSKFGINAENVADMIDKLFLRSFFRESGLYAKDIARIIQIADLDGTFAPHESVVQAPKNSTGVRYENDKILAPQVDSIHERNERKGEILRTLVSMSSIKASSKEVPYSIYFFSANLEHVLQGDANVDQDQKMTYASRFARQFDTNPSHLFEVLSHDTEYSNTTYEESWSRIQEGCNSLHRHSNLGILINQYL